MRDNFKRSKDPRKASKKKGRARRMAQEEAGENISSFIP